ncbi:MAG: deoxyribonuclease IV [Candidatus Heimdallarchaeota archaeon]|nr:deoxyribonuclease IV [Candidatus Heimdallarchaeota archaeon]
MVKIGFHASVAGGIHTAFERAIRKKAEAFQIFLNSPRVWKYSNLEDEHIDLFIQNRISSGINDINVHLSYLPNLAGSNPVNRKKSIQSLNEAIKRCEILNIQSLVLHIGSHLGKGIDNGIANTISMIDEVLNVNSKVKILLETSSGSDKLVGNSFQELHRIIEGVSNPNQVAVCFDTCHAFAAGYDLKNHVEDVFEEFDQIVGLEKIHVIHANDSKGDIGSKRDRHEHIGLGYIGLDAFKYIINKNEFKNVPLIIETPNNDIRRDSDNLSVLHKLRQ